MFDNDFIVDNVFMFLCIHAYLLLRSNCKLCVPVFESYEQRFLDVISKLGVKMGFLKCYIKNFKCQY